MHLFLAATATHRENRCSRTDSASGSTGFTCTAAHAHLPRGDHSPPRHIVFAWVQYHILSGGILYIDTVMINSDFYRPWKIATVVFRNPPRDLLTAGASERENFFLFMCSITRAQMPTLCRKTCFNTGVGDDDGADDVMLIFVLVNPVVDRIFFLF